MEILEGYLNILEVSQRLQVHPETVRRLCRQGDLPGAIKAGNTWLIDRDKLQAFAGVYQPKRRSKKKLL